MKANELMIGDWVHVKHYDGSVEPIKILNIYGNEVNCTTERNRFDVDEIVSGTYMIDLYPIPLTPEILEKNFPKEDFVYWEECKGSELYHIHIERCFQEFNGFLKYVHELQHVLRLCGIKKEIKL